MIKFVEENLENLKIEIEDLSWPKKYEVPLFDIVFRFSQNGVTYEGRGTDRDEDLALTKALAEAVERFHVCYQGLPTSNGVAIHSDEKEGKENARNELIERDLFFSHYITQTPMERIDRGHFSQFQASLINFIEKRADLQILKMNDNNGYGICTLIDGRKRENSPFGLILGLAYNSSKEVAVQCSLIEALRDFASVIENGCNSISLKEFNQLNGPAPIHHSRLGRDIEYAEKVIPFFYSKEEVLNPLHKYDYDMTIGSYELVKPFEKLNLKLYKASSPKIQDLFFGVTEDKKLNIERLRRFKNQKEFKINYLSHPFG